MSGTPRPRRLRRLLAPSLVTLVLVTSACTGNDPSSEDAPDQGTSTPVRELTSIDALRDAFNDDAGSTRLILLVSPT